MYEGKEKEEDRAVWEMVELITSLGTLLYFDSLQLASSGFTTNHDHLCPFVGRNKANDKQQR
jgi:hypothetical protein